MSEEKVNTLSASTGSELARAIDRIHFLDDPNRLNVLFDEFERDGMPMGSELWVEYVLSRYLELKEKERTLSRVVHAKWEMDEAVQYCGSKYHRERRDNLTKASQDQQRLKDIEERNRERENNN